MLSLPSEEDLVVKWLFAEAINYKNKGKPIRSFYGLKWASKTRIHKIIFSVLEEFKIPVTRSWYKWGGFVHSDELEEHFNSLLNDYSRNPERTIGLCKKAENLGLPADRIRKSLEQRVNEVTTMRSKDFLLVYYRNESPLKYREMYVAKQEISNFLDDIATLRSPNVSIDRSEKIGDCVTRFHEASLILFNDALLREASFLFTDTLENALDKVTLLAQRRERISNEKRSFFGSAKAVFDDYVWNPYACKISQETVKGLRAVDERARMKYQEERKLDQTPQKLNALQNELIEKRLELSFEELQTIKEQTFKNQKTAQALSEVIGIYSRGKDGE
jgi:hypothetical protein